MSDKWLEKAEETLFHNSGAGMTVDPNVLLTVGDVNKTVTDETQAYYLIMSRLAHRRFSRLYPNEADGSNQYDWMLDYPILTEQHQQAMSGENNARQQFIKLGMAQMQNLANGLKKELENLTK